MKWILLVLLFSIGCLRTRSEVEEIERQKQLQEQVINIQKNNADQSSRFSDLEVKGAQAQSKIEVLENRISQLEAKQQSNPSEEKIKALEEGVVKLDSQVQALIAEMSNMGKAKASSSSTSDLWTQAEDSFSKGDWKQAIFTYEKFREKNSKSKKLPEATYKIGVCFQELGMREEARGFYDEVISKYPKSKEASKSKTRKKKL